MFNLELDRDELYYLEEALSNIVDEDFSLETIYQKLQTLVEESYSR